MQHPHLGTRLYNAPLLLLPEKAEVIERVFAAYQVGDEDKLPKFEAREHAALMVRSRPTAGGYLVTDQGIAIVAVHGSLVQRSGGLDAMSGITGYNVIQAQIDAALRDPIVRGVVLDVDSPGGEVAGAFELAAFIAAADKPVWAVANELAASAAYLIASAAEQLYVPTTAEVGSVGVVMLHQDRSALVEKSGVRYTPIFAGAKKLDGSSLTPLSESARLDLQARVDDVYEKFVGAIAERRGIKTGAVRATEAGMLSAERAVDEHFADQVGTLTEAITAMSAEVGRVGYRFTPRASRASDERKHMNKDQQPGAAPQLSAATTEQLAQERAAGYAQAEKDITAKAKSEGAEAERTRIAAILAHAEAKDRPAAARQVAMGTAMPVDAAATFLAGLPKETPAAAENPLAKAMKDTNPKIGADGDPAPAGKVVRIDGAAIFERRRGQPTK